MKRHAGCLQSPPPADAPTSRARHALARVSRAKGGPVWIMVKAAGRGLEHLGQRIRSLAVSRILRRLGARDAERIPTWTSRRELETLYDLASTMPPDGVALEIGSYLGASSCYLGAGLADLGGRLVCVDTWQNETMPEGQRDTLEEFRRNVGPLARHITLLRRRSSELAPQDVGPVHFVFIDGDHSYAAAKADFALADSVLSADGVMALHDCNAHEGVARVVGEALSSGRWVIAGHLDNLVWLKRQTWPDAAKTY